MDKSILILDTPRNCEKCNLYYCVGFYCELDHCPLIPLPARKGIEQYCESGGMGLDKAVNYAYAQGYNDCLGDIIGENNDYILEK